MQTQHSSRKKEDKNYGKYVKWVLVIPKEKINQLGWKEGEELKEEIKNNSLHIHLKSSKSLKKI